MKAIVFLLLCFLSLNASHAQEIDLTGTWTMFEMTYVSDQGNQVMTAEQMKAEGAVTEYIFMEEGKVRLTSNMSGSGTLDTYEGTWKLSDQKLTFSLNIGDRLMDVVWNFEYKDEAMNLSRTSPDGSMTIINSFKRK